MPVIDVTPEVSGGVVSGEVAAGCAVCPHPLTFHDRIAARFCTATVAGNFSRGCVCAAHATAPETTGKAKDVR
jgi:hypothetical protein